MKTFIALVGGDDPGRLAFNLFHRPMSWFDLFAKGEPHRFVPAR